MIDYDLHLGDCLDILPALDAGSIDAVICDPPYGTTSCKWDSIIDLPSMWAEIGRVIRPRAPILLFAADPFSSMLVASQVGWYKYKWYWRKNRGGNFAVMKFMPASIVEEILVFGRRGGAIDYYPQMTKRETRHNTGGSSEKNGRGFGGVKNIEKVYTERHPTNVLDFPVVVRHDSQHPTQKPVALMEYLIHTYTQPGGLVLDFTMGSGSTGVAAMHTGRRFIGIEAEAEYHGIATERISRAATMAAGQMLAISGQSDHSDLPLFADTG